MGVVFGVPRTPLLARLPTRLPPCPGAGPGGSGLSLLSSRWISGPSSRIVLPLSFRKDAPGLNPRWQTLLSQVASQNRRPAQHKNGFLPSEGRNPVERAPSRNHPPRGRTGRTGDNPTCLPLRREHHAPARALGPGVGKVLRKVPIDPPWVNHSKRLDRDAKPRGADSRTRFRTRQGASGLTPRLPNFATHLRDTPAPCKGFAHYAAPKHHTPPRESEARTE